MKPKFRSLINAFAPLSRSSLIVVASLCAANSASAASQTWDGDTDATWVTATNWVANAVPGAINPAAAALVADVATFNSALVGGTRGGSTDPILIDHQRQVRSVLFDTANAGPYVLANAVLGNQFWLGHTGNVTVNADVTSAQTISADTQVRLPSSTDGTYSFINNATTPAATLTFSGTVSSGAASSRPLALTLGGSNTGSNAISGVLTHVVGQRIDLIKNGTGTWLLSNANDLGANATPTNAGSATINGGKLIVTNNAALSTNSANSTGVAINDTGTLEISGSGLVMDNGLSLNLNNGGTIQSIGTNTTNGRINVGAAASTSVTISAVNAATVFTVGNGTNDFTGGSATSTVNIAGAGTVLFAAASNYAGGISIGSGSTLQTNSDTALGAAASANLTFVGNGKLQIGSSAGRNNTVTALNSNSLTVIEAGFATGTSTLTVSLASGTTTYTGLLQNGAGTLALTKSGLGTLTLNGTHTYTGATTVNGGGTLNLDFSAVTAPTNDIISPLSALVLGSGSRGVLNITGKASTANTQTFASLNIGAGLNQITYAPGATGGTTGVTITAATAISGSAHGTLRIDTTGTTTFSSHLSSAILLNGQNNAFATYGTNDWAATNGSGVVVAATYTDQSANGNFAAANVNVTGSFTAGTAPAGNFSLRFADPTGQTVTLGAATYTSRGILVASTAGTSALNGTGPIRNVRNSAGSNYDFPVIQNSPNDFTIGTVINDASTSTTTLLKSGSGRLILTAANTYGDGANGGTVINGGVLSISSNTNLGTAVDGRGITLNGGSLETTANVTLDNAGLNNRAIALSSASGIYAAASTSMTVTGVVSGSGALNVNPTGGTYTSSGNTITDTGTIVLNNIASTFTGNINVNAGVLSSAVAGNAAGTGATSAFGQTNTARNININNGGTVRFDAGDVLIGNGATPSAAIVIAAGGMVTNTIGFFNTLGAVTLNGGTLTGTGGSASPQFQMYQLRGAVTVGGSAASTISGAGTTVGGGDGTTTVGYHLNGAITFNVADATSSSASDLNASAAFINGVGATPVAGGITKTGAGTMTLGGINTYTGNTLVQGGALVLADNAGLTFRPGATGVTNSIAGTGTETLTLDGDFTLDLTNPAALVNGGSWVLVNVASFAGATFGSTFTVTNGFTEAANVWTKVDGAKTWTFTEATGTLSLALAGYAGWAGPNAGGQLANADFDNDGVTNGVEYFMNAAAGFTANPALNGSNVISWTNGGNLAPGAYGTEFVVQTSNDLAAWVDVLVGDPALSNTAGLLSYTLTGSAPRFVRLKVTPN